MKYLIDTCVISETQKPSPDRNVLAWFAEEHYNRDVKIIEACREKDWLHRLLLVIAGR